MDIKAKIDEVVAKIKADENFAQKFKTEPIKAVEEVLGVDLPDDIIQKIIDGVKAKINLSGVAEKLGGLGNLFNK
ncbi:MAG: hypothetical protein ACI4QY_02640 [Oscillospiraceae bacterium]